MAKSQGTTKSEAKKKLDEKNAKIETFKESLDHQILLRVGYFKRASMDIIINGSCLCQKMDDGILAGYLI